MELLVIDDDMLGLEGYSLLFRFGVDEEFVNEIVSMCEYQDCENALWKSLFACEQPYRVDGAWAKRVYRALRRKGLLSNLA